MARVFIGIGGNIGDRFRNLRDAIDSIRQFANETVVSPIYETAPVGYLDQPAFLNAVVQIDTDLSPDEVLQQLLDIEAEMGRQRSFRNAPRTVDLDILLYDDAVIEGPNLTVPHPRLHERAFVLVPLADLALDLIHPRLQRSIADLLAELGNVSNDIHIARSESS